MFRAKVAEMLRRNFRFLNELREIEEKERLAKESAVISSSSASADTKLLDLALANQLANFDPSNPMWSALGFVSDKSWTSPGFLTRIVEVAKSNLSFP